MIIIPKRQLQIFHTRLRTGCSSLNNDLFLKNIADNPLCGCISGEIENTEHYCLKCRRYDEYRLELYREVTQYSEVTLNVLLKGKEILSVETNIDIFKTVQKFILSTKDFKCYVQVKTMTFASCCPPLPPHRISRVTVLSFSFFPLFSYLVTLLLFIALCFFLLTFGVYCFFFFFFFFFCFFIST